MGDIGRRLRSVWRALRRSKQLDADMRDEMRLHIEMEAERLRRVEGLDPQEARRRAHVRFGGVEKYKEEGREARGFALARQRCLSTHASASGCSSSTAG